MNGRRCVQAARRHHPSAPHPAALADGAGDRLGAVLLSVSDGSISRNVKVAAGKCGGFDSLQDSSHFAPGVLLCRSLSGEGEGRRAQTQKLTPVRSLSKHKLPSLGWELIEGPVHGLATK